jgi:hypothetical protein
MQGELPLCTELIEIVCPRLGKSWVRHEQGHGVSWGSVGAAGVGDNLSWESDYAGEALGFDVAESRCSRLLSVNQTFWSCI